MIMKQRVETSSNCAPASGDDDYDGDDGHNNNNDDDDDGKIMTQNNEEEPLVEALTSGIPQAGLGLFATKDIAAGSVVAEYTGKILTLEQAKVLKDRSYLKAVTLGRHIDGNGIAKYINDHHDPSKHNVKFEKRGNRIFVIAKRNIKSKEELFISYGRGHWLFHGSGLFLGLEVVDGALQTTKPLKCHEVVLCYSSPACLDIEQFAKYVHFSHDDTITLPNCRLKPSPFVHKTVMITTTKQLEKNEKILVRSADRISISVSTIGGAGLGAFARVNIPENSLLGEYSGKTCSYEEFQEKSNRIKNVLLYGLKLPNSSNFIDPTDTKGRVKPFQTSNVCFINDFRSTSGNNAEFFQSDVDGKIYCKSTKSIEKGAEIFASYESWFDENVP